MKIIQRIPTSQFAYVEFEEEYESVEDGMADHKRILKLYESKDGLPGNEWAKVRNEMLITGQCDPNLISEMSASQRYVINQIKLALRSANKYNEDNEREVASIE